MIIERIGIHDIRLRPEKYYAAYMPKANEKSITDFASYYEKRSGFKINRVITDDVYIYLDLSEEAEA